METRRFDQLTVALARDASRRGVLAGLGAAVMGALALDQSRALAKKDRVKSEQGGGKPITNPAKPICDGTTGNCPLCYEARFGPVGQGGCCDPARGEQYCLGCIDENTAYCSSINNSKTTGTCVTATCSKTTKAGTRCEYTKTAGGCQEEGKLICCARFTSTNFGHCVASAAECQ